MTSLNIRKLDEEIIQKLKLMAAADNISMEEEVRRILTRAVKAPQQVGTLAKNYFGEKNGVNLKLSKRKPHKPLDFS